VASERAVHPERAAAETANPGVRGEPTDAERGRTLLAATRTGALSTVAVDPAGFPFGSLVAHAVDDLGRPLLCLSDLAEHTRNLAADPRASLMAADAGTGSLVPGGGGDPLASARVTVLGSVGKLDGAERAAALETYRAVHPAAFYSAFDDFRLYRLEVASVRYVGGFGRMSWVSAADHTAAEPDPLHPHVAGIVGHLNDDHADALVSCCRTFGARPTTAEARTVTVDRYGFTLLASDGGSSDPTVVRIPFGRRVDTIGEVRAVMIELLREALATGAAPLAPPWPGEW
jgi:heme iron utilization protein